MPQEFLSSPPAYEAASALEQALARVVAHVRAEFVAEKRAMDAELKLAHRELTTVTERIAQAHGEFAKWLAEAQRMRVELRGEPGTPGEAGKDGAPGTPGQRGLDGAAGHDGMPGLAGEPGKDGAPGARGLDGAIGRDGRDGLQGPIGERGKDGRDGIDGKDGKDGLGFDDTRQFCDADNFGIEFLRGNDVIRKFTWPLPTLADFHCGPYRVGEKYRRGQCATYGGSTFLCLRDTEQKPETDDWRLIVKHGLPGRSGKDGDRGPAGPAGHDGRDLTQMTSGGLKYG